MLHQVPQADAHEPVRRKHAGVIAPRRSQLLKDAAYFFTAPASQDRPGCLTGDDKPFMWQADQGAGPRQQINNPSSIQQQFVFAAGLAAAGEVPLETEEEQWWDQQSYQASDSGLDPQSRDQSDPGFDQQSVQQSDQPPDVQPSSSSSSSAQPNSDHNTRNAPDTLAKTPFDTSQYPWDSPSASESSQHSVSSISQGPVSMPSSFSQTSNSASNQVSDSQPSPVSETQFSNGQTPWSRDNENTSQEASVSEQELSGQALYSGGQDAPREGSTVDDQDLASRVSPWDGKHDTAGLRPEGQQRGANPGPFVGDDRPSSQESYWSDQIASVQDAQQQKTDPGEEVAPLEVEQMNFEERLQAGRECFR